MTARRNPTGRLLGGQGMALAPGVRVSPPVELWFRILGRPVPKARARVTRHGVYTPDRTVDAENNLRLEFRRSGYQPLEGPVHLELWFAFAKPAFWPKARRLAPQDEWHTVKPDLDNLVKLVQDAGNGLLWRDDVQVVRVTATKVYAIEEGTVIKVNAMLTGRE